MEHTQAAKYVMRVQEILFEKFIKVEVPRGICMVHECPGAGNLLMMFRNTQWGVMRGLVDGDLVYWWDAERATHDEIAKHLGMKLQRIPGEHTNDPRRLTLTKEGDGRALLTVSPEYANHPRLQRLIGHPDVVLD